MLSNSTAYREEVSRVFRGLSDKPVLNGTLDHACIVVQEAFKAADKNVRVLASAMDKRLFAEPTVRAAICGYLQRPGVHLDILVEEGAVATADALRSDVACGDRARVSIGVVPKEHAFPHDFIVVDQQAYRFAKERDQHAAVVAGGPSYRTSVDRLLEIFAVLKDTSTPLDAGA